MLKCSDYTVDNIERNKLNTYILFSRPAVCVQPDHGTRDVETT